ncbi:hypothetical protein D3C71_1779740 [compost metagenome]
MAKLKKSKVRASTLLEVIVAMVIILIVFVMATGIFTNVIGSAPSVRQLQIRSIGSAIIQESLYQRNWNNETIQVDSIIFQKTVAPYQDSPNLLQINVVALERGKELGKLSHLVKKGRSDAP